MAQDTGQEMSSSTPEILLLDPPAEMPSEGTEAYDLLLKETGGASANPGFNYVGHIKATRGSSNQPSAPKPEEKPLNNESNPTEVKNNISPIYLLNPPSSMPTIGTEEYKLLLQETGGASSNPGFNYKNHIAATRKPENYPDWLDPVKDIDDRWLPKDVEKNILAPIYLSIPPARMPKPGTKEYAQLLEETGGASANPGFNYKSHIAATRKPENYPDWLDPVKDIDDRWLEKDHNGRAINPISLLSQTDTVIQLDDFKNNTNISTDDRTVLGLDGNLEDYRLSFDSKKDGELLIAKDSGEDTLTNISGFDSISISGYIYNSQDFRDLALQHVGADFRDEVQRLYNTNTGNHVYSANQTEIDYLTGNEIGWVAEGVSYKSDENASQAVYRFFVDGKHFYTANERERDLLINSPEFSNYIYEGESHKVYGLSDEKPEETIAVKRYFNTLDGSHIYSTSIIEQNILSESTAYVDEGIAWYAGL